MNIDFDKLDLPIEQPHNQVFLHVEWGRHVATSTLVSGTQTYSAQELLDLRMEAYREIHYLRRAIANVDAVLANHLATTKGETQ